MLTDTHCHLNFRSFDADREHVLERAAQHGVAQIINPGINLQASRDAVALADEFPAVYAAVGIHPNEAVQSGSEIIRELRQLARNPKVAAIGEIGLDYHHDQVSHPDQASNFRAQLDLAAELGLPVIIHCREAYSDVYAIIEHWQAQGGPQSGNVGVFHSFSGDQADAQVVLSLGFCLGITGSITFPRANRLRQIVADAPLESLVIETDAPFLTPQARRGKRNEPAYVRWVADKIADERGISSEKLARATTSNAAKLFAWDNPT